MKRGGGVKVVANLMNESGTITEEIYRGKFRR